MRPILLRRCPPRTTLALPALGWVIVQMMGCGNAAPPPPDPAKAATIIQDEVHTPTKTGKTPKR